MNTQNIKELENSQNKIISKWNAKLMTGIKDGYVNTEDDIPWTTVMGYFDKESGLKFAQELSNEMNIKILINRIETWFKNEESILHLVYDINPSYINKDEPVKTNQNFEEKYGIVIEPKLSKKLKIT